MRVFVLDVKSGFIGKEILRETICEAIKESEINNYAINADDSSDNETDFERGTVGGTAY